MCDFITIGFKSQLDENLRRISEARLIAYPATNPIVSKAFGSEYSTYYVTSGHCSCDFFVNPAKEINEDKLLAKYEKMGWSKAKIQRAINSAHQANKSKADHTNTTWDKFLEAVENIVLSADSIRLFNHFYSGNQNDAAVTIKGYIDYTIDEFKAVGNSFPNDTIITIG